MYNVLSCSYSDRGAQASLQEQISKRSCLAGHLQWSLSGRKGL